MNSQLPLARKEDLVVQNLPDEMLVYDCKTHKAFCLNKTSASVWNYCDGKTDVAEIALLMEKEFGSTISKDLVWLSISQLSQENLLAEKMELPSAMQGINRREVVRRTAIAAAIALPIISSITAPSAANAQSAAATCNQGTAFTTPAGTACPAGCGAGTNATCDNGAGVCSDANVCT